MCCGDTGCAQRYASWLGRTREQRNAGQVRRFPPTVGYSGHHGSATAYPVPPRSNGTHRRMRATFLRNVRLTRPRTPPYEEPSFGSMRLMASTLAVTRRGPAAARPHVARGGSAGPAHHPARTVHRRPSPGGTAAADRRRRKLGSSRRMVASRRRKLSRPHAGPRSSSAASPAGSAHARSKPRSPPRPSLTRD